MHTHVNILKQEPLFHGFSQLILSTSVEALPGQYVILEEKYPLYIWQHREQQISLLIPAMLSQALEGKKSVTMSSVQGNAIEPPKKDTYSLFLVEEGALATLLFYLEKYRSQFLGLILIGTTTAFPFKPCPSRQIIPYLPAEVIAGIPLLEEWRIPHRLASIIPQPGVFHGNIETLAQMWETKMIPHLRSINKMHLTERNLLPA